ncbi:MAG: DUF2442 domain-containing protein [Candidatus Brocadiaceae bacterium]|nr:DUF2442 domain-containing protein [Candidatus Brocadiaceae bacterium]
MYYEVIEAKYIDRYKLVLIFENGKKGTVDLHGYTQKGGVFSRFSDIEYFKRFYINKELCVLCWPDDVDIAPKTLYSEATGEPLPEWMTPEIAEPKKKVSRTLV